MLKTSAVGLHPHFRVTGGAVLAIAYGIETQEENDPYVDTAEHALGALNEVMLPGAFLVDLFPFSKYISIHRLRNDPLTNCNLVKYIPEWVPGAGFKTKARLWGSSISSMLNDPWKVVQERMVCL